MTSVAQQGVLFPGLLSRPIHASFREPHSTSDGGALLLKALDDSLGLTERVVGCLRDDRQPGKIRHECLEMVRQRVFGIACGYEDANDAGRIAGDPLHKLLSSVEPGSDDDLASQPTLSRFENSVGAIELYRMGDALCDAVVERHQRRLKSKKVKKITIDMDATVDPTHGMQQLSLFNGKYDTWCYLPLVGFLSFNNEPEQYLFAAILRPGTSWTQGTIGILRRIIDKIRDAFPKTKIQVRLDAGFAQPAVFKLLDEAKTTYWVAMAGNSVLQRLSAPLLKQAKKLYKEKKQTATLYGDGSYSARSWKKHKRRVVYKAEVLHYEGRSPKEQVRFVITNAPQTPRFVYHTYVQRGDSENRIKELKNDLIMDRTSCSSFLANQFRVLLAATAYVFFQELRLRARRTSAAKWQVSRIRLQLFKIAAKVTGSVRRISLSLSQNHPWSELWIRVAKSCGAVAL